MAGSSGCGRRFAESGVRFQPCSNIRVVTGKSAAVAACHGEFLNARHQPHSGLSPNFARTAISRCASIPP